MFPQALIMIQEILDLDTCHKCNCSILVMLIDIFSLLQDVGLFVIGGARAEICPKWKVARFLHRNVPYVRVGECGFRIEGSLEAFLN